jgi:phosphatidylglycerol---prolipoprotein diacylglyceryl transferase
MIIHNIDPVLFSIGNFNIYYYSLVYIIGILFVYYYFRYLIRNTKIEMKEKDLEDFTLYFIIGVVIGGRIGEFIFFRPLELFSLEVFKIWNGGMSFHGGLIGLALVMYYFCKKKNYNFYKIADYVVLPVAFFLFLGRIANFINGELVGIRSNLGYCIQYSNYEGCRHPSQIYEALKNLIVFFIVYFMKVKEKYKDGVVFWSFILFYGVGRFITDFYRDDARILGISMGQFLSLLMIIVSAYYLKKKHYTKS